MHINLESLIKELDLFAPIHFQRRANSWLRQLRTIAVEEKLIPLIVAGDVPLDYLDVLRGEINIRNGAALMRLEMAQKILERFPDKEIIIEETVDENSVAELAQLLPEGRKRIKPIPWVPLLIPRLRLLAYKTRREFMSMKASAANGQMPIPVIQSENRLFVLPRLVSHLKNILPVVAFLKERYGVQILFGVVSDELAEVCKNAGYASVNIIHVRNNSQLKQQTKDMQSKISKFVEQLNLSHFDEGFTEAEIAAMKMMTLQVVKDYLLYSLRVAENVKTVFEEFRPSLFFACNPYTMEGRAAIHVAKRFDVPTASSEHGSIFPNDPIWQECLVDLVCVFGEPSRRALLACDVRPEQIAVTGAPHFDEIFKSFQKQNTGEDEASILVATSGPGDQVSLEQHQRFINILYEASTLSPDVRWAVKLHTKDREDFYTNVALNFPSSRVEVISGERARFGTDIFDYLSTARALVTICSTSAMDAMLVNVPVITVALESKEKGLKGIEFMERGCTLRVETAEELARIAQDVWRGLRDEQVDRAAREYISEHYANFGNATENVAERLLNLMGANEKWAATLLSLITAPATYVLSSML